MPRDLSLPERSVSPGPRGARAMGRRHIRRFLGRCAGSFAMIWIASAIVYDRAATTDGGTDVGGMGRTRTQEYDVVGAGRSGLAAAIPSEAVGPRRPNAGSAGAPCRSPMASHLDRQPAVFISNASHEEDQPHICGSAPGKGDHDQLSALR